MTTYPPLTVCACGATFPTELNPDGRAVEMCLVCDEAEYGPMPLPEPDPAPAAPAPVVPMPRTAAATVCPDCRHYAWTDGSDHYCPGCDHTTAVPFLANWYRDVHAPDWAPTEFAWQVMVPVEDLGRVFWALAGFCHAGRLGARVHTTNRPYGTKAPVYVSVGTKDLYAVRDVLRAMDLIVIEVLAHRPYFTFYAENTKVWWSPGGEEMVADGKRANPTVYRSIRPDWARDRVCDYALCDEVVEHHRGRWWTTAQSGLAYCSEKCRQDDIRLWEEVNREVQFCQGVVDGAACGASLVGLSTKARHCSEACKKSAQRFRATEPTFRACALSGCDEGVEGRRKFCSAAHKQAAWRDRECAA